MRNRCEKDPNISRLLHAKATTRQLRTVAPHIAFVFDPIARKQLGADVRCLDSGQLWFFETTDFTSTWNYRTGNVLAFKASDEPLLEVG